LSIADAAGVVSARRSGRSAREALPVPVASPQKECYYQEKCNNN